MCMHVHVHLRLYVPGLVRISTGIEDADDLIDALKRSLDALL